MFSASKMKGETSSWTEDGLNIVMNLWTLVLNSNLFGCVCCSHCVKPICMQKSEESETGLDRDPDASVFQQIGTDDGCRGEQKTF